jgi:hypothetical protein
MRIQPQDEEDLEQALAEIHRRASAYEGPLMSEFMELARLSSPVEVDEPLDRPPEEDAAVTDTSTAGRRDESRRSETKQRFEEALSLLMVLAFPPNRATEQAVRLELNEVLGHDQRIDALQMRVDDRKVRVHSHLARRPTKRQIELRNALLELLPTQTPGDL